MMLPTFAERCRCTSEPSISAPDRSTLSGPSVVVRLVSRFKRQRPVRLIGPDRQVLDDLLCGRRLSYQLTLSGQVGEERHELTTGTGAVGLIGPFAELRQADPAFGGCVAELGDDGVPLGVRHSHRIGLR